MTLSNYNIPVINNLRGVAATMVCFYHFVVQTVGYIDTERIRDVFHYGDHGVYMFFVISGIVIPLSMIKSGYDLDHWSKFILKRFIRLEPPYLCAVILAIIYFQVRRYIPSSSEEDMMLSGKELLLHVGYLVPFVDGARWAVPSLWTLSIEFQYYLLLSVFFPFAMDKNYRRFIFYFMLLIMPLSGMGGFFPHYAALFLMGIVYAFWFAGIVVKKEYLIVTTLSFIVTIIVLPLSVSIAALLTLLIIHFASNIHNKYLGFLGAISYSLYLTHQITGTPVINFLSHHFRETYQKPIVILAGFAVSICFAYILYRLVELPSMRWSKSIRYKEKPVII